VSSYSEYQEKERRRKLHKKAIHAGSCMVKLAPRSALSATWIAEVFHDGEWVRKNFTDIDAATQYANTNRVAIARNIIGKDPLGDVGIEGDWKDYV